MKRILAVLLCVCGFYEVANANNIAQLLLTGRPSGHMGVYYQGMTGGAPSFADANVSLAYQTHFKAWHLAALCGLQQSYIKHTAETFRK